MKKYSLGSRFAQIGLSAVIVASFVVIPSIAMAATSGPNHGSSFSGTVTNGTTTTNWSSADASHLQSSDNTYATVSLTHGLTSKYLQATGFGFNIPAGATINGIQVTIEKHADSTLVTDDNVFLVKAGSVAGSDLGSSSGWASSDTNSTYGGSTNLWGTTWSASDINNANFGVVLSAHNGSTINTHTASVDYIQITVSYTPASITITPSTLPNGTVSVSYSQNLTASTAAIGPFTWSHSGTLPAGLTLGTTGTTTTLSGTPTASSTYNFSVTVTNGTSSSTQAYTVTTSPVVDNTPPILAQVTPVPNPTNDTTPSYTFSSTKAGTITYGGSCSSAQTTAVAGNNTITFKTLTNGTTYSNCTIKVTDSANNASTLLFINPFTVNTDVFDTGLVTFSFDNGTEDIYQNAIPILDGAGYKTTQYIITTGMIGRAECEAVSASCYSDYMDETQVKNLYAEGHEIASHTRSHIDLSTFTTPAELQFEIDGSRLDLLQLVGVPVNSLSYPYGVVTPASKADIEATGMVGARTVTPDQLNTKSTDRFALFSRQVNSDTSIATIQSWIDQAVTNRQWLIFTFHKVDPACGINGVWVPPDGSAAGYYDTYCTTPTTLTAIVNYLKSQGSNVQVPTMSQGLAMMNNNPVSDGKAPVVTQANITAPATSASGTPITFLPTVTDLDANLPAPLNAFCTVPNSIPDPVSGLVFPTVVTSGSVFPIGTTTAACDATDAGGNLGNAAFNVVVTNVPPVIGPHADVTAEATSSLGASVTYTLPTVTDTINAGLVAVCTPPSSSLFALGTTTVTCNATDSSGSHATSTTFHVIVTDTTVPIITITGSSTVHTALGDAYTDAGATASDIVDGNLTSKIVATSTVNTAKLGTYSVTYTVSDSHGNAAVPVVRTVIVDQRPITVTATTNTKPYDGTTTAAAIPTITSGSLIAGDTATFKEIYSDKNVGTGKTLIPSAVITDGNNGNDYLVTLVNDTTGVITQTSAQELTVTGITASNKVYDATTTATINTNAAVLAGVGAGDTVTLVTSAAKGSFSDKNIGTGKTVTISDLTLTGADAVNYSIVQPTTTADVTAKTITATATADNKVYDGTTAATVHFTTDAISGDTVTATAAHADFADAEIGNGKTVTMTGISIDGADAGNYALTATSTVATADITSRTVTVSASGHDKVYDGTTGATVDLTVNNVASGDTLTATGTAAFVDSNAGTNKTVHVTAISIDGTNVANYTLEDTATDTAASITGAASDIALSNLTQTYDGTPKPVTVTSDFTYTVTYDGSTTPPTDTGSYAVVATVTDPNHTGTDSGTLVIKPIAITVTADAIGKLFGSSTDPALTYTFTGSLIGSTTFSGSLVRAPGEALGTYPITQGTLALDSNYAITFVGANFTISVDPSNPSPVADSMSTSTYKNVPIAITLVATDTDAFTYATVTSPTHGVLSGTVPDLTYTPNTDYTGSDSFTFKANDGNTDSNTATISISVNLHPTCPDGFTLNGNQCTSQPVSGCPSGTAFDASSTLCESATSTPFAPNFCATGTLSTTTGQCVIPPTTPTCPPNTTLNASNTCDAATSTPSAPNFCVTGTLSTTTNQCVIPPVNPTCSAGFTLNGNQCVNGDGTATSTPTCPDGTTLDSGTNQCTTAPVAPTCPPNTTLNGDNLCQANATAPVPPTYCAVGTYDAGTNMCVVPPVAPTCPPNTTLNGDNLCAAIPVTPVTPTCPTGSTLIDGGMCQPAPVKPTCPTGFALIGDQCVTDTAAPVITLNGDATVNLTVGASYTDAGATATDSIDGSIPVTVGGDTVNTSVAGTYHVTYDATDSAGNHATQVVRTVNVTAPAPSGGGGGGGSVTGSVPTTTARVYTILDFNTLLINWGKTGAYVPGDFNNDGTVDILDFNMLLINWSH